MLTLSATDVAIAHAHTAGALMLAEHIGRFGPYVAISDHAGLIEVADSMAAAYARIDAIIAPAPAVVRKIVPSRSAPRD